MTARKQTDIFQAIDHQQSEYRRRQYFSEILYVPGCGFPCREKQERQKSGQHCPQHHHSYCNYLLCQRHFPLPQNNFVSLSTRCLRESEDLHPTFSNGLLSRVSTPRIAAIAGIIKFSESNATRHSRESPIPTKALA